MAGNPSAAFDTISLSMIEDERVQDVQSELAAEQLVPPQPEFQADYQSPRTFDPK